LSLGGSTSHNGGMAMTADEVRQMVDDANAAYAAGDYHRAGELFSTLFIEPEALEGSNELHWNYAMCLVHDGNWPLALEHVRAGGYDVDHFRETCRQSNLRDAEHDYQLAAQLYANQQWNEAADAFTELLLHPGLEASLMRDIHWNIAMCLGHGGDYQTALEHVRASGYSEADFRSEFQESNVDLARQGYDAAAALYTQGRWSEAADAFAELLISPGLAADGMDEIQWNLAMCFAQLGNWETAFGHIAASGNDEQAFRETAIAQGLQPPDTGGN
jgi:tetratricopeptide (TPR) repeat protein